MGPCTGHGSGGTRISSAYNIRWQVSIPSFKSVTFGHVIHKLVQHIPKEGGSEQEGDLSFKFHSIKVCNICYLASIFSDLSHTFQKQVANVSQHVFVNLLWGIFMSPLSYFCYVM